MIYVLSVVSEDLKRLGVWLIGITLLVLPFILFWDEPIAWYFETELNPDIHRFMGNVTEAANSAIWLGLGALGVSMSLLLARQTMNPEQKVRRKTQARAWLFMIMSMVTAAAVLNILKLAIGRYRPRYLFNEGLFGFEPFGVALKMASFPSGHAQSIWSAMIALSFLMPRFMPAFIAIAVTVSASRFVTAVHFVSDVIFSSFLSIAIAILVRRWFERNGLKIRLSQC